MSVHKNVLKVLGLETKIPPIVYEFAGTEILSPCISAADVQPLSWKCRLKIAIGIVDAVAYLHNAFSRPVIHREIDCSNIILDQNNVPKLYDVDHFNQKLCTSSHIWRNLTDAWSNPVRHFSAKELLRATTNYDTSQIFVEDTAIGSQMSVHKNVFKVIGCCLETEVPTIVYEFAGTNIFSTCISGTDVQLLPWKSRLKIAIGLANVLAYLHTAFSRPVIHRDIKSSNIILDQNNAPKPIDFRLCISIPEGQSHLEGDVIR
ncbi:hypothetical protein POUND7_000187 [Theobroma cacao]